MARRRWSFLRGRSFQMRYSQSSVCGSFYRPDGFDVENTIAVRGRHTIVRLIMVRMLMADDAVNLVRSVVLQRGLARQIGDRDHPAEPGFGAELLDRNHPVRAVERTGE